VAARDGLTGVLLVGGGSTRFGAPKALARLGGRTLAEIAWETLGEACDERLAVGKLADGLDLPFAVLDDGSVVRAPIAGIVAGLRAAAHDVSVVLPIDCPLVTAAALRALALACADAAVPTLDAPLPGAYRRSALPVLERRLAGGELAIRDALAELDVRETPLDPALLLNVNTPAELEALQRLATGSSPWGETMRSRSAPVPTSDTGTSSSRSTSST
jgi:molybdopterin-guanine dinucleotide biosynthesis protein A